MFTIYKERLHFMRHYLCTLIQYINQYRERNKIIQRKIKPAENNDTYSILILIDKVNM